MFRNFSFRSQSDKSMVKHRSTGKGKEKKVDGVEGSAILAENRHVYGHKVPEKEVDMQQLIDNHEPGHLFPYVATTGEEVESPESRIQRIMRFIPSIRSKRVKMDKRLDFVMTDEVEHISLSRLIGDRISMKFFSIPSIMFAFSPTVSLMSDFTDVYISLIDSRFRGKKQQQQIILSSNKHYKGEMCIDYSIPRVSADNLEFCVTSAVPILNTGEIWGALQVEITLRESSFPEPIPFKEVMGSNAMPTTGLLEYNRDPTRLNLAILDGHTEELREMKNRGEITDVATAHVAIEKKMTYASSRIDGRQGAPIEPSYADWDRIRKNTKTRAAKQSVSPPPSHVNDDARSAESKTESIVRSGADEKEAVRLEDAVVGLGSMVTKEDEKVEVSKEAQDVLNRSKVKFAVRDIL